MPNAFIRKLDGFNPLSDRDRETLERLCAQTRDVKANQELVREGDLRDAVLVILEGFACRYKIVRSGERSIVAYLVPGDTCDWHRFVVQKMDHSIGTLSPCKVADIPSAAMLELTDKHPTITRALWWSTLVDEGTLREWIVNVTRRSAEEAVAHLFCEMLLRLEAVGLRVGDGIDFPLKQAELADTVGLSTVHANRVLQKLRKEKLIRLCKSSLQILNVQA